MQHEISKLAKIKAEIRTSTQRSRNFSKTGKAVILRTKRREMQEESNLLNDGTKHMKYIQKVETRFRYVNTHGDLRQKYHQEQEHHYCKAERRTAALLQEKEEEITIDNAHNLKVSHFFDQYSLATLR